MINHKKFIILVIWVSTTPTSLLFRPYELRANRVRHISHPEFLIAYRPSCTYSWLCLSHQQYTDRISIGTTILSWHVPRCPTRRRLLLSTPQIPPMQRQLISKNANDHFLIIQTSPSIKLCITSSVHSNPFPSFTNSAHYIQFTTIFGSVGDVNSVSRLFVYIMGMTPTDIIDKVVGPEMISS